MLNRYEALYEALQTLKIYSLRFDAGMVHFSKTLDGDDYWEAVLDGIYGVFEKTDGDYDEERDEYSYIFNDRCFTDYYKLARKYGRRHNIPFNKNPYVRKAELHVNGQLGGPYTCYHRLRTERRKPGLHFYHCSEFCCEDGLLQLLIDIKRYFKEGIAEIKAELANPTVATGKAAA
jgi:hypothetical protein